MSTSSLGLHCAPGAAPAQRGSSLIIVVILLVILMVSALALVRSSETMGAVAGNVAFKQAATDAADIGIAQATAWLAALANAEAAVAGVYYATQQNVDGYGLPTVDWTPVPATAVNSFRIQYLVERLCQGPTPVANVTAQCLTNQNQQYGSRKVGSPSYSGTTAVYYRVTVRVRGPRNSESFVQSLLAK
jgi:type IV pilus assembly protein PilX